jgi:hypothetical protein
MRVVVLPLMFGVTALAGADPISVCRQAHGQDAQAHIACLEQALRSQPTAAPAATMSNPPPAELGSEQVRNARRAAAGSPEVVRVQIVSVAYNAEGRGVFVMADGQEWRETERTPQPQRLKTDRQYTGTVERGRLGGYRMYLDDVRRMIKVERVK